jgi:hypothetical protein
MNLIPHPRRRQILHRRRQPQRRRLRIPRQPTPRQSSQPRQPTSNPKHPQPHASQPKTFPRLQLGAWSWEPGARSPGAWSRREDDAHRLGVLPTPLPRLPASCFQAPSSTPPAPGSRLQAPPRFHPMKTSCDSDNILLPSLIAQNRAPAG